jgi:hypothetical protein
MIRGAHHIIIIVADIDDRRLALLRGLYLLSQDDAVQEIGRSTGEGIRRLIATTITAYVVDNIRVYIVYVVGYAVTGVGLELPRAELDGLAALILALV